MQKKNKIRKGICLFIATVLMAATCTFSVFAADASVGSAADDINGSPVGVDSEQSQVSEYYAGSSDLGMKQCNVYATVPSSFTIVIPKTVILSGVAGTDAAVGRYSVKVYGSIGSNECISVAPDAVMSLSCTGKSDVTATISQDITSWQIGVNGVTESSLADENQDVATGTITATLTSGKWSGSFNFNIQLG